MFSSPLAWKGRLRQEILAAKKLVILAMGNKSKGDDAAGLLCAEELKKLMQRKAPSRLKILVGYETPENYTGKIRNFLPDLVLILDAAQGDCRPGSVFIVEKDQIEDVSVSTHKISLALLISYLEETIGCKVIILGIQPLSIIFGQEVSRPVKKSVARLAKYLAHIMERPPKEPTF